MLWVGSSVVFIPIADGTTRKILAVLNVLAEEVLIFFFYSINEAFVNRLNDLDYILTKKLYHERSGPFLFKRQQAPNALFA